MTEFSHPITPIKHAWEYAFGYKSNPRNTEFVAVTPWNEQLIEKRNEVQARGLLCAPQHPLVQWGITRGKSDCLTAKGGQKDPSQETTDEEAEDESSRVRRGRSKKDDDKSYNARPPKTHVFSSGMSLRSKATPPQPYTIPPPSTPQNASSSDPKTPSSTETRAARQSEDSYFTLDFAMIKTLEGGDPTHNIFGYQIPHHDACIPIALEIKRPPTRDTPAPAPNLAFQHLLNLQLRDGYRDIHLKLPVAFRCHPQQKSIIGIAASGPWWSVTVVGKGDKEATWSKAFQSGYPPHEEIMRRLFEAAAHSPNDPASYPIVNIRNLLAEYVRVALDRTDALCYPVFN